MRYTRTASAAAVLLSSLLWFVIVGAGSRSGATPRLSSSAVTIKPQYASTYVFTTALRSAGRPVSRLGNPIRGAVVNHHLIVPGFIADTLHYAQGQRVDRIILLAPNHFFAGHGKFITTDAAFVTPYGIVRTDQEVVRKLVVTGVVVPDTAPFSREHGIYTVLPFLRRQFPDVPVVPLITRDGTSTSDIDAFTDQLSELLTPQTLVIASLDFAHNQTNTGAQQLDEASMTLLSSVQPSKVEPNAQNSIQVDSPMTLRLFLGLMRKERATAFTLTHHSNSALETGHLEATDVTSHITGLFSAFPVVLH